MLNALINMLELKYFALYAKKVSLKLIKWKKFMILKFKIIKFQKIYKIRKSLFYVMIVKNKVLFLFIFIRNVLNVDLIIQQNNEISF